MARGRQEAGCGAKQHASSAEDGIGRGRNGEYRARSPDQRARVHGREKQRLRGVANAVRVAIEYLLAR